MDILVGEWDSPMGIPPTDMAMADTMILGTHGDMGDTMVATTVLTGMVITMVIIMVITTDTGTQVMADKLLTIMERWITVDPMDIQGLHQLPRDRPHSTRVRAYSAAVPNQQ